MKTNTLDAKEKRSLEQRYALRKQVIRMRRERIGVMKTAELTGLN